jgi:hypothetical protein
MRNHGSITPMVALKRFGCFRLAARIKELRDDGNLINSAIVTRRGKRYAAYSLVEGKTKAA